MIMDLPYIDEHRQPTRASREQLWSALLRELSRQMGGSARFARLLGCDPSAVSPSFDGHPGDTVPGFRVREAQPGYRLVLEGRHRFSRYELTFVLDGDQLRAQTHAAFPGVLGKIYRAAVIGTGGHRVITRRLLKRITRAARS